MSLELGIYERIKQLRKAKRLTQKELAKAVNVSPQVISNWERGYTPTIDNEDLLKLANVLETSFNYLLTGNDDTTVIAPSLPKEDKKPKDLQKILDQHEIMFSGTPLTEEDKQAILDVVELQLYKRAKELNKRKKPKEE